MPPVVAHKFYRSDDEESILQQIESDILDPLGNEYLNKHLIYAILDLVLVRLIPELTEQPISELLAERGVLLDEDQVEEDSG